MSEYFTAQRLQELEARLSPRDLGVLERVAGLRFLSGAQLTRLHFWESDDGTANARAARRALLRLVSLHALARLQRPIGGVRAGSAGFVYHLGVGGQRLANTRAWQPERRRRRSLTPGQLFLRHTLAVAELHTRLVEGDRSRRFELLELVSEPSCWRSYGEFNGQRLMLKPDSYARLGIGEYEDSYFFEVDRGTEGSRAIERQLERYVTYYRVGREEAQRGVFPTVLWLSPSAERSATIRASVASLPSALRALFRVAQADDVLDVLTPELSPDAAINQLHTS